MIDWAASPRAFQLAQLLILIATALLIGSRFLPSRHRQRVGVVTTMGYLAGLVAFVIYLAMR